MQFPNIEDDEGDFGVNSTTRSRLSSLFQSEKASGDVNQALTFTAPKQPKKNDNSQSNQGTGTLKLIHASAVNAYKLVDGNYTVQGKLGCAILGWHEASNYQILLYKGKQVKVATCNIHQLFKFQVQQNNYAMFYDDRNENWSINFDVETALVEFAKQIALAKANSLDKNQPSLIIQDLTLGEGPTLDTGDSAEVKYTGWLLTNYVFGQVFDTNMQSESAFRLRLGKKVIKGWSEGLVGAQKGTRRLLIVPPHLAYGAEGMGSAVPPNSTLIFEIIVAKVKVSRDSSHSPSPLKAAENLPEKKPEVQPRHSSISSEDNIRQRGASISEQLTQSPKKDKAQLISRMAKMGTATLPFHGAIPAQVESDSESEEDVQDAKATPPVQLGGSRTSSPKPASRSSSRKNSDHLISAQPAQLQSVQEANVFHANQQPSASVPFYPPAVLTNHPSFNPSPGAYPAFQPQMTSQYQLSQYSLQGMPSLVPQVTTSMVDTHLPMLITETRSQNTEVRLSLSKITEKIDTVIQKVDDVRYNQGRSVGLSHSSHMDSSLLLQSIEKIVQENSQLKEDVEVKNSKIQSLNEKIYDLLQRNQRFFEESNSMLEQKSDSLHAASAETQAKIIVLEKEKAKLSTELSDALRKLGSVEVELASHQKQEIELKQKLQEEQNHAEELDGKLSALRKKLESESSSSTNILQTEIKELSEEKTVLNSQIKSWEEKYAKLSKDLTGKNKELQTLQEQIDSDTASKVSSNNEEIVALKRKLQEALAENDALVSKYKNMATEHSATMKSESLLKEKVIALEGELQNALPWKGKYEVFYRKTLQMKENYESVMKKLEAELQQAQSSVASTESPDFSGEIKRMMNILYKLLQGKFEPSSSYSGTQVLETTLQAIRTLTVQMLQRKGKRSDTIAKEVESTATNVSSMNADSNENFTVENSVSKDNPPEAVSLVQDNGVAPLSNELPVENETKVAATGGAEEKSSVNPENSVSDSQITENKVEKSDSAISDSNDELLQNHIDSQNEELEKSSVSEESSKSEKEKTEESKTISQSRESPDLSAANIPDTSNSVNTKVWRPQPPPLFDDDSEEDDDDWLK
ncbi:FK506-binding protein 15 isoform X4 [Parasteatoda tepidariorum]|uniref:FK506-binding protein 15 isoform X4 n=1 Tax=Parasteatoda tepidariorum TaxID=114398 RepID=UPI00077FD315|nr:FK506-binding protein 15 isoform X4 [Parasteatoda tepidariorum]